MNEMLSLATHYRLGADKLWQAFWVWRADANLRAVSPTQVPTGVELRAALMLAVKLRDSEFFDALELVKFNTTLSRRQQEAQVLQLYAIERRQFEAAIQQGAVETPHDMVIELCNTIGFPSDAHEFRSICSEIVLFDAGLRGQLGSSLSLIAEAVVLVAFEWAQADRQTRASQFNGQTQALEPESPVYTTMLANPRLCQLARLIIESGMQNSAIILYKHPSVAMPDWGRLWSRFEQAVQV